MQTLLLGVALLVLFLLFGRAFVNADPKRMAQFMRQAGGVAALSAAFALFVTGRIILALPLAAVGMWLLGRKLPFSLPGGADDLWGNGGQVSRVRTAMLEMTLDHATGATDGTVLAGRFTGRPLSGLTPEELAAVLQECMLRDQQGAQLLRAYMERAGMKPEQPGMNGGTSRAGAMTAEEAYAVLGLAPGATAEEINAAHRALMKRNHPDQGGSTYLASKINEAKDVLLRQV
jgi:hypothetical protein